MQIPPLPSLSISLNNASTSSSGTLAGEQSSNIAFNSFTSTQPFWSLSQNAKRSWISSRAGKPCSLVAVLNASTNEAMSIPWAGSLDKTKSISSAGVAPSPINLTIASRIFFAVTYPAPSWSYSMKASHNSSKVTALKFPLPASRQYHSHALFSVTSSQVLRRNRAFTGTWSDGCSELGIGFATVSCGKLCASTSTIFFD
mmetsp:Transcript_148042/g.260973  ORF Transcript_148042/g.260973 Transcript_148042/m.260973 type:complete len:200 (+) Transcript_148042:72-671(+)